MAMLDVYNAVNAQLTAILTASGHPELVPSFTFGPWEKQSRQAPPVVGWEWSNERFSAQERPQVPLSRGNASERSIRNRVMSFDIHLWFPIQTFGPVIAKGSGGGWVVASGAPDAMGCYIIQVATGGAPGVATFTWSDDSGRTFTTVPQGTGGTVALSHGVSVTFSGTMAAGDSFLFHAHDQLLKDYATTEFVINALVNALHQTLRGYYELGTGQWTPDGSEALIDGKEYVLGVSVVVPVFEMLSPSRTLVTVTSIQQTDVIGNTSTTP